MASSLQPKVDRIIELLVSKYQPDKVILFGSAAGGNFTPDSDLDLVVIKQTDKRFYDRIGDVLQILWSQARTPGVAIDVLVYTPDEFSQMSRTNYFIKEEVQQKGLVVYERHTKN